MLRKRTAKYCTTTCSQAAYVRNQLLAKVSEGWYVEDIAATVAAAMEARLEDPEPQYAEPHWLSEGLILCRANYSVPTLREKDKDESLDSIIQRFNLHLR